MDQHPQHQTSLDLSCDDSVLRDTHQMLPTAYIPIEDRMVDSANTQSIQDVAKVLGIGPTKCFEWLRRAGILMANNLPYQCYIAAGYFKVSQRNWIDKNDQQRPYARSLVTGKGLAYLQKRYQTTCQETAEV